MNKTYYFILMSQKDFLENQVIEELLRERANYYTSKGRIKDYWIINSPKFVNISHIKDKIVNTNFYKQKLININSQLKNSNEQFYSALITSDFEFFKWLKLRIGYFEDISMINNLNNTFYISDGISGKIDENNFNDYSPLESLSNHIHPDILLNRYKKSIEIYYKLNV